MNEIRKVINYNQKYNCQRVKASDLSQKKELLESQLSLIQKSAEVKYATLKENACTIGNIIHHSDPISIDEGDNALISTWSPIGINTEIKICLSHYEVLLRINGYDPERGTKIVGHRGYFLRQFGVFFNQALINYALSFLTELSYIALKALR